MIPPSKSPYDEWLRYDSLEHAEHYFSIDNPVVGTLDTETNGLHILASKPFLFVFGWYVPNMGTGRVFTFYPTPLNMKKLFLMCKRLHFVVMVNGKYDLHMCANIGHPYPYTNVCELQAMARLTLDAVSKRDGGNEFSVALKNLAYYYLHASAKTSESFVKKELTEINKNRRKILLTALKQFPLPEEFGGGFNKNGRPKTWTKKALENFFKDPTHEIHHLPEEVQEVFVDWSQDYPPATYQDVYEHNPEAMVRYAQDDGIAGVELYRKMAPVVMVRKQTHILRKENEAVYPLWRMERSGIKLNRSYLIASKERLQNVIRTKRQQLCELFGTTITPYQGKRIIQLFLENWGIELPNAQEKTIADIAKHIDGPAKQVAKLISDLRTQEKWLATYCKRLLEASEYDGRIYFQINQSGTVSGRVSSDSQQFPKGRILTEEGYAYEKIHGKNKAPKEYEIFNPRRAIEPTDAGKEAGYTSIVYFDYSQVELRIMAHYTILCGEGDENLCRAYMPYGCVDKDGNPYRYWDVEGRKEWNKKQWFDENGKPWQKTDVHGETAHNALIALGYICDEKAKQYKANVLMNDESAIFGQTIDEKGFEYVRTKGKIFNFMRNYGGGKGAAMSQLDLSEIAADAMINGYDAAFPGVANYQKKVIDSYNEYGYVPNMYHRRYYLSSEYSTKAYRLGNLCIQGTNAEMIKEAIIRVDALLQKKQAKSRLIMTIHDEIQLELWKGEEYLLPLIKEIMEDHPWSQVPIVCDLEITYTNWAEKKAMELKEEVVAS